MTSPPVSPQVERILESALGALSDWLELVRVHENERRARQEARARARRDHATRVVMAVLSAIVIAAFFWLGQALISEDAGGCASSASSRTRQPRLTQRDAHPHVGRELGRRERELGPLGDADPELRETRREIAVRGSEHQVRRVRMRRAGEKTGLRCRGEHPGLGQGDGFRQRPHEIGRGAEDVAGDLRGRLRGSVRRPDLREDRRDAGARRDPREPDSPEAVALRERADDDEVLVRAPRREAT